MSDIVALKNGPHVRESACVLAIALESRGHLLTAADGVLKCSNGSALTPADRAAITKDKAHLVAICEYIASGAVDASR